MLQIVSGFKPETYVLLVVVVIALAVLCVGVGTLAGWPGAVATAVGFVAGIAAAFLFMFVELSGL